MRAGHVWFVVLWVLVLAAVLFPGMLPMSVGMAFDLPGAEGLTGWGLPDTQAPVPIALARLDTCRDISCG